MCVLKSGNISRRFATTFILLFAFSMSLISIFTAWHNFLPSRQFIKVGDRITEGWHLHPLLGNNTEVYLKYPGQSVKELTFSPVEKKPVALRPGQVEMNMKLFGLLPFHRMTVNVVRPPEVFPGGHSIGILMHSEGVMVVGEAPVLKDGKNLFPARKAGIHPGDLILSANGLKINSESQLQEIIEKCGSNGTDVILLVKHEQKTIPVKVKPLLCEKTGRYRVGLFVKGTAAGVGTLTFYEPSSKIYGALGHIVADVNSGQTVNLENGKIVEAVVKDLYQGKKGQPGEKLGVFKGNSSIVGDISKNTPFGIFGKLADGFSNPYFSKPIPVAMKYQVKEGPAEILTVLKNNRIEKFNIVIERVMPGEEQGKDMIIRVTDRELIQRAGGIIQGMSGSPIIQEGKLAGAVTHVFINDPTRGYGVAAENMLIEANLINVKQEERLAS